MINNEILKIFDMIHYLLDKKEDHSKIDTYLLNQEKTIQLALFEDLSNRLFGFAPNLNFEKFPDIMFIEEKENKDLLDLRNKIFSTMLYNASEKISIMFKESNVYTTNFYKCGSAACSSTDVANAKLVIDEEIKIINPKIVICCSLDIAKVMIYNEFNWNEDLGKTYGVKPLFIAIPSCYELIDNQDEVSLKMQIWNHLKNLSNL